MISRSSPSINACECAEESHRVQSEVHSVVQGGLNLQRLHNWDPQTWHCTLWQIDNNAGTFIAERGTRRPPPGVALNSKE
jgi:hypothetical protein